MTLGRSPFGQGPQDIIGLHAGHRENTPTQEPHQVVNGLNLTAQIFRHGRAVGLVGRIPFISKGWPFGIEHTRHVLIGIVFFKTLEHIDHAPNRSSGLTGWVASDGAQIGHRVVSAVKIARAVYEQEL